MENYFVKLLLQLAVAKEGKEYAGKPASFYQNLLTTGVDKVQLSAWDYTNYDEAEFNTDLIYAMTFTDGTESWIEEYPYKMNFDLNKQNKLEEFYETQGE